MRQLQYAFLITFALFLAGCSTLPETPRQSLAVSYVAVESLADTVFIAHQDGIIDDEQRSRIKVQLQLALDHLALAEQALLHSDDTKGHLESARIILTATQSYLSKQVKP